MGFYLFAYLVIGIIFTFFGRWVAIQKHRSETEGLILGFLFGPFGVLGTCLLPTGEPPESPSNYRRAPRRPPIDDMVKTEAGETANDDEIASYLQD